MYLTPDKINFFVINIIIIIIIIISINIIIIVIILKNFIWKAKQQK